MDFTNIKSPTNQYMDRPIVFSPPPLDPNQVQVDFNQNQPTTGEMSQGQEIDPQVQAQRQFSVGYNLQHEFETLTNDLDLDLKNSKTGSSGGSGNGNASGNFLANKFNFAPELLGSNNQSANSILRDGAISPIPQGNSGIASMLSSNWGNLDAPIPERPQSVNDFMINDNSTSISNNFYQDLLMFTNWIENLAPKNNIKMIDYLCSNLPLDILLTFKSKLDSHLTSQPSNYNQFNNIVSPNYYSNQQQQQLKNFQHDLTYDMDQLNIQDKPQKYNTTPLLQPKPKQNYRSQYLFQDARNRPKSADPNLNNTMVKDINKSGSPTSHLYEKTNFLQAAANSNSPMHYSGSTSNSNQFNMQQYQQSQQPSSDEDVHAALKLGALATINSRVALDSNRKHNHHQMSYNNYQQQKPLLNYEESINRTGNSSSAPLVRQMLPMSTVNGSKLSKNSTNPNMNFKQMKSPELKRTSMQSAPSPTPSNSSMPMEVANLELLENIPAWLKLLRLHKYTDCLKDIPWRELVEYDNNQLEERGVVALGARRKLLKAFDVVKVVHL